MILANQFFYFLKAAPLGFLFKLPENILLDVLFCTNDFEALPPIYSEDFLFLTLVASFFFLNSSIVLLPTTPKA